MFARIRVLNGELQASLGRPRAARAESGAPKIEHGQRDFQTLTNGAENILLRHTHVAQGEAAGGRSANSHFFHARLEHFEPWHVRRNQKRGNGRFVRTRHRCARHHGQDLRNRRIGDVALFPIQNEMRTVFARTRLHLHIGRVGTRFLLRERKRTELFARHQFREPLLFLLGRAEQEQRTNTN